MQLYNSLAIVYDDLWKKRLTANGGILNPNVNPSFNALLVVVMLAAKQLVMNK